MRVRRPRGAAGWATWVACLALTGAACQRGTTESTADPTPGATADGGAAPVRASASVDRAVATIGDAVEFAVTVDFDRGFEVEVADLAEAMPGFRILDVGSSSDRRGRRRSVRKWALLRADQVGSSILPPVGVRYRRASAEAPGDWQEVETARLVVEIESLLAAAGEVSDVRDIKPLRELSGGFPPAGWAVLAASCVALAWLARRWWRRRGGAPEAPPVPAHVVALAALERLRAQELDDADAVRRFHFSLSEVVRAYVEGRFALNATDLTTEEIRVRTPVLRLPDEDVERLHAVLRDSDRVKFARYAPGRADIEATVERCVRFVERTVPVPESEPAEDSAA